jgi:hypothetical protein
MIDRSGIVQYVVQALVCVAKHLLVSRQPLSTGQVF